MEGELLGIYPAPKWVDRGTYIEPSEPDNVSIGAKSLLTTDHALSQADAYSLKITDIAGTTTYHGLYLLNLLWSGAVRATIDGASIEARNTDNNYIGLFARNNTVAQREIARLQSAATSYFSCGSTQQFKFYNNGVANFGGDVELDGGNITCAAGETVDGVDVSAHEARHKWLGADEINIRGLMFQNPITWMHMHFETQDGWTEATTGTGSVTNLPDYFKIETGATNGSTVAKYLTSNLWISPGTQSYSITFEARAWGTISDQIAYAGYFDNPTAPTDTEKHIGWKFDGTTIYASNGNGTNGTQTDTGITLATVKRNLTIIIENASSIKYYVDGVLKATHTTNIPASSNLNLTFYLINSVGATKSFGAYPIQMMAGAF